MKAKEKMTNIGCLVKEVRKSKGVRQEDLCKGLCDRAVLVRFEQGKCNSEKILIDAMLQRLGLSINKFGAVYSNNEYECYELRREIVVNIVNGDIVQVKQQLIAYEKYCNNSSTKTLHNQFIKLSEILMEMDRYGKYDKRMEVMIRQALCLTCLDFQEKEIMNYLLCDKEITLILLLAENLFHQEKVDEALDIYYTLISYIDKNVSDEEELTRLYPKVALLLSEILLKLGRYKELIHYCRKGIQILRENHKINFLEELLSVCLAGWKADGSIKYLVHRECYQTAINGLKMLNESVLSGKRDIQLLLDPVAQGYLIGNQISVLRKISGLTQEDFGEICEPVSISKIEHGRKPTESNYRKIMDKMGRDGMRYYSFILSDKYMLHVARSDFSRYIMRNDYHNAEKALLILETGLDGTEPVNCQYLMRSRALLDNVNGKLSQEMILERLMEAIRITAPADEKHQAEENLPDERLSEKSLLALLDDWPLTQMETVIWNNIANAKGRLGNIEEKIQILSKIKKNYEMNPVNLRHNAKGYLITMDNLVNELEYVDADFEALRFCEEGIRICIEAGEGYILINLLVTKATCLKKIENNEETCLELFKQAFSIAYILGYDSICNHIKKYCEEAFRTNLIDMI